MPREVRGREIRLPVHSKLAKGFFSSAQAHNRRFNGCQWWDTTRINPYTYRQSVCN